MEIANTSGFAEDRYLRWVLMWIDSDKPKGSENVEQVDG